MQFKLIFIIISVFILSCNTGNPNQESSPMTYSGAEQERYINNPKDFNSDELYGERLLIKNGSVRFKTEHFQDSKSIVMALIKSFGGFIQNESTDKYDNSINLYLECKIPSKTFDSFLDTLERILGKPESRNIRIEDITKNYRDTEARIQNKKELENRFRKLLKKASSISEILEIESKLNEVRLDIEQYEQQKKNYDNQLTYSVLNISIYQEIRHDFEFFKKVGDGLHRGWINFMWFVVWLVNLWPFVVLVILIFGVRKLIRKKV